MSEARSIDQSADLERIAKLERAAATAFESSGRCLAATFATDLIGDKRDAFARAERFAARGLELTREARRIRRDLEAGDR